MKYPVRSRSHSLCLLVAVALAGLLAPSPAAAQVELEIVSPTPRPQDANFRVGGTYGFSVAWVHPSTVRLYATSGNQRKTWYQGTVRDLKSFPPDPCPINGNPNSPGWDFRCQEQIGHYWKYQACGSGTPCENNGRWNAYPGSLNVSATPVSWLWPAQHPTFGIPGFTPVLTREAVNSPPLCNNGSCPPPTGVASTCHPGNPDSYSKGVANGKVVEVYHGGGNRRWFMVYNSTVKTNNSSGSDRFRMAWAWSNDGYNWTTWPSFLLRSSQEASSSCASKGFLVTDMFIDSGKFYFVFFEIGTSRAYLARAPISAYPSVPGFGSWQVSGPIVGGQRTWINLPVGGSTVDLVGLGAAPVVQSTLGGLALKQTDINRVYKPGSSGTGLVAGVDYQYVMVTADRAPFTNPVLQVWTADTLDDPFQYQSQIDTSSLTVGLFGWEFALTQYPDNLDATPRLVGNQLDFWVVQNLGSVGTEVTVTRATARLKGGIYGP